MPRSPLLGACALAALLISPAARAAGTPSYFPVENRDTTCAPCHDFDQFANGNWRAHFVMPAAYSRFGAFTEVSDRNQEVLLGILKRDAVMKAKPGSDETKLGDYWSSCMDSTSAEKAGLAPVQPLLSAVDSMTSTADLARQVAWFHAHGTRPPAARGRRSRSCCPRPRAAAAPARGRPSRPTWSPCNSTSSRRASSRRSRAWPS